MILGIALIQLGLEIEALSDSALEEWYPKREFMCFEHSGEFSELFRLQYIGNNIQSYGLLIILVVGVAFIYLDTEEKARKCHTTGNMEK